ncbi:MAG: capsular biosynthesis protein [Gammaproteobacteria bacterium]|nr:capsular biosynthesis protein [Gammaproteobacteria bacterium]MBP6051076.1 capsular biosynthesis protein [Pseudomonadales bacterium]MBK6584180.1 capsular biosynthesis protein [Gammaproteobacteria bacterium]MBK7520364.1 capsular biosynthesis protein [Gammaproteobacteria bacterium]MBK7728148.1 capsular biosynthesis protein [Gammaproteobacteria bacterium]
MTGTVSVRVLLIWRFSHHASYFRALATQSSLEMVPFSKEDLPAITLADLAWLWQADIANLAATHIDRLTFGRHNRLRPLRALRRVMHSVFAALACARFHRAFLRQRPDAIAVWNGGHWFFQAAIRAAREFAIPVFYCENGLLPDTTTFDPRGINYHNAVPRAAAFYRALAPMPPLTRTSLVARKPVRGCSAQPLTLPRRYLFVPLQMNRDTQIVFNSPWIRDMYQLLQVLRTVIERVGDAELSIVVKEHPSCTFRYDDQRTTLGPRFLFANGNSTQELIDGAEAVITVNSTVGLEALLRERRVIVIGSAFYAIDELVLRAGNEDELVTAIDALVDWQPDTGLRHQFLGWLETVYCIPGSWRAPDAAHCRRIEQRLENVVERGLAL